MTTASYLTIQFLPLVTNSQHNNYISTNMDIIFNINWPELSMLRRRQSLIPYYSQVTIMSNKTNTICNSTIVADMNQIQFTSKLNICIAQFFPNPPFNEITLVRTNYNICKSEQSSSQFLNHSKYLLHYRKCENYYLFSIFRSSLILSLAIKVMFVRLTTKAKMRR